MLSPVAGAVVLSVSSPDADGVPAGSVGSVGSDGSAGSDDVPVAGISTDAFLYPQTVHSSCFEPASVAVAALSVTHSKEWATSSSFSPQAVHSCQWFVPSDIHFVPGVCPVAWIPAVFVSV